MSLRFKNEAEFARWQRARNGEPEPPKVGHHRPVPSFIWLTLLTIILGPFVVMAWAYAWVLVEIIKHANQ